MSKLISALCDTVSSRRCGKVKDSDDMIRMEPSLRVASKFRDFLDDTRTKYRAESTNVFLVHGDEDMTDSIIEQASAYGIDPDEVDYLRSIDQVKKWVASLEPLEGSTPISGEEEDKMWDHLRKFRRSHNL